MMNDTSSVERKSEEAAFHNKREVDRQNLTEEEFLKKYPNKRFYVIARKSHEYQSNWLEKHCKGKDVLDYCCGLGETSLRLAKMGGNVHGIDISADEVRSAKAYLEENGIDNAKFVVGDAEESDFEDSKFDVIVCNGVLHHLDVKKAWPELARLVKPDGHIMAMEALGYNPIIQLYRRMTPNIRTAWETDHILKLGELDLARQYFGKVEIKYFYLATLFAIPFINTPLFSLVLKLTETIDSVLTRIPGINLMAWQMVFVLSEPKKSIV